MRRSNEQRIYGPYEHGDTFRLHLVRGGGRGRKTSYLVFATRALAEAALAGARSQAQGATVKMAVDALVATMKAAGRAEGTIATAEYRLDHFFALARNGNRPLSWLRTRGEELYAAAQVGRSADTHQAELALAKQVGSLAVKRRWLRANPFAEVESVGRKKHGSTKSRHRVDESRKLLEYCLGLGADQHAIITMAYLLLGSRASELVKRDVRDIDDRGSLLWISRTKTLAGNRKLLIPEELRVPLLELVKGRKSSDPIFTKEDGTRATRYWAYHHVRRICADAKVTVLSPQGLRRTQSDLATEAGETAMAIARHLGQASSVVTDRSYRDRNVVKAAQQQRAFRVLAGGKA